MKKLISTILLVIILNITSIGFCEKNFLGVTSGYKVNEAIVGIRYAKQIEDNIIGLEANTLYNMGIAQNLDLQIYDNSGEAYYLILGKRINDFSINTEIGYAKNKNKIASNVSISEDKYLKVDYKTDIDEYLDVGGSLGYFLKQDKAYVSLGYTKFKGIFCNFSVEF